MMGDRTSYMQGFLAGLPDEDLSSIYSLVNAEQEKRNKLRQAENVRQPPPTPIDQNKPLPVVGAKRPGPNKGKVETTSAPFWSPSKGSAAIRITDDEQVAFFHYEEFGKRVRALVEPLKVVRLIKKDETVEKDVTIEFFYVYKDKEDARENRALIVFPYGCMDYCKAALPVIKKEFESAEIYTGSTQRGKWE
jgi:hypothetical protein